MDFILGNGIHGQHARLGAQGDFAHLRRKFHVFVEVLRPDFDFRQAHDAVGSHFFLGAHVRLHGRMRFLLRPAARQQSEHCQQHQWDWK